MQTKIQTNENNDLKYKDGLDELKKKEQELQEAGNEGESPGKIEYITD